MTDLIQRLREFTVDNGDHLFHPRECWEAAAALEKAQGTEKEGWRYADELKARIAQLESDLVEQEMQIDALQQKVHLCAGYDNLEKELAQDKAVIVGKMSRIKQLEATLRVIAMLTESGNGGHVYVHQVAKDALQTVGDSEPHAWVNQGHCCRSHTDLRELMHLMIVCPQCGDKRCPKAEDCRRECTQSVPVCDHKFISRDKKCQGCGEMVDREPDFADSAVEAGFDPND